MSTKGLSKDKIAEILVNKGVVASEAEAVASKMVSTAANGVATFSWKAYTAAIWENIKATVSWMFSNPIGWILAIGGAIGGAILLFNHFNETIDEQKRKNSRTK